MPNQGLANGATINNQASIVFDANAAIGTNSVTNTIVSVYPTSNVTALPSTTTTASFPVSWSAPMQAARNCQLRYLRLHQ